MPESEFDFRADDGQTLLGRRWLPEGPPRAVLQIAHGLTEHSARYARLAAALNMAGYAVYANDHRGHGPKAAAADLGHFADEGGWDKVVGDLWTLNRLIAAEQPGRSNRLPRPLARLVPRARIHRQAFGRAGRRGAIGIERQAAGDRDARAADRPRGAPAARQARQERPHLSALVRRIQQAIQACAHRLRLALARREGGRRFRRRSALRLSIHDPARDRRARRAPPTSRAERASPRSARICRSTSSPASATPSAPTSKASSKT